MDCSLQPGIGSTSSFQQNDSKIEIQLCLLPLIATCPGFTRVHGNCGYCGSVLQIDFCFVYIIVHTWWCKSPRSCQHRAKLWLEHLSQIFVVINQCPSSETETVWIKGSRSHQQWMRYCQEIFTNICYILHFLWTLDAIIWGLLFYLAAISIFKQKLNFP